MSRRWQAAGSATSGEVGRTVAIPLPGLFPSVGVVLRSVRLAAYPGAAAKRHSPADGGRWENSLGSRQFVVPSMGPPGDVQNNRLW